MAWFNNLNTLMKLGDFETRLVTAENVNGEKGRGGMANIGQPQPEALALNQPWWVVGEDKNNHPARDLGAKYKVRPCISVPAGETVTIMDVKGPGVVQHIWWTTDPKFYRDVLLRFYWDDEETPSVEAPFGDFFCNGWRQRTNMYSLPMNTNPSGAHNCYFPMPFRKRARITAENIGPEPCKHFFYAITYALAPVADEDAYFHAQFRRTNPLPYGEDYTILDDVRGDGQYVGTYLAWQQNNTGWWGEGEIKFFLDGDGEYPTLCGTGTEDYFGGAWGFGENYSAPFLGYPTGSCDGKPGNRHGLYRFHILDPIRFRKDLRVTIQALGWRSELRFLPLQDDLASVAYWYQREPHAPFPATPTRDQLEVI